MALLTMATARLLESNERDQRALMLSAMPPRLLQAQRSEAEHLAYLRAAAALITRQRGVDAAMIEGFHRDLGDNLAQLGALGLGWVEVCSPTSAPRSRPGSARGAIRISGSGPRPISPAARPWQCSTCSRATISTRAPSGSTWRPSHCAAMR